MTTRVTNKALAIVLGGVMSILNPMLGVVVRAQGPQEGIKVHGHWVIDIQQPDGTLVSRHEFENALVPEGGSALAALLTRQATPGVWSIVLIAGSTFSGTGICQANNATQPAPSCLITTPLDPAGAQPGVIFQTLTVNLQQTTYPGDSIQLKGSMTAALLGQIASVGTRIQTCDASVAPAACPGPPAGNGHVFPFTSLVFTSASGLPAPIPVVAGQIIQVTVTISFS